MTRLSGNSIARPAASEAKGARYYDTGQQQVYVSTGGSWVPHNQLDEDNTVGQISGATLDARPDPNTCVGWVWTDESNGKQYEAFPDAWAALKAGGSYMGVWQNKSVFDDYLASLEELPLVGDWGIIQNPLVTPGVFFDHQGIEITGPVMFIIVDGLTFGGYADWPAYEFTPFGNVVLWPQPPPPGWNSHYPSLFGGRLSFLGRPGSGLALGGYYSTTPPGSEMDLFFQEADENHGARYQLEVYSEHPEHPSNWTDAFYYSGTRDGVYILDPTIVGGGDYIDYLKVGPPTAPNRFDPAVGLYDA